ncbi:MAG: transglutaminase domain-containing protein [Lachnospiraceae bacterium]|nr:transglutaminase domain-containing protein [Lachnospiraceae bacterium]
MKKKIFIFSLISYLLCMALAGCGTNTELQPPGTIPPATDETDISTPDTTVPDSATVPDDTTSPGDTTVPGDATPAPDKDPSASSTPSAEEPDASAEPEPETSPEPETGLRDNTPRCLVPTASGSAETHNEYAAIDYSNASEGYFMACYTGTCAKVKMQVKGSNGVTYTYNLNNSEYVAFPLSSGSGSYEITILENVFDSNYAICLAETINVTLSSEFKPYLYPNQYCAFSSSSRAVSLAKELAEPANTDLDVITNIYNYVIESISYDYDKAATVPSGYIPDVDAVLSSGKGICLDYAAVMTSMLRSQRIPTRLEVGYAGDAYHAWISAYISDVGWVNGIVRFDGNEWELMDPTFASMVEESELKDFISNGSNYVVKYLY